MEFVFVVFRVFPIMLVSVLGDCPWRIKSLYSSDGRTGAFYKSINVRSSMHCVHICLSTPRCHDVHFANTTCRMFKSLKVAAHNEFFGIFHVRNAVWPKQFVLQKIKIKKKSYETKLDEGTATESQLSLAPTRNIPSKLIPGGELKTDHEEKAAFTTNLNMKLSHDDHDIDTTQHFKTTDITKLRDDERTITSNLNSTNSVKAFGEAKKSTKHISDEKTTNNNFFHDDRMSSQNGIQDTETVIDADQKSSPNGTRDRDTEKETDQMSYPNGKTDSDTGNETDHISSPNGKLARDTGKDADNRSSTTDKPESDTGKEADNRSSPTNKPYKNAGKGVDHTSSPTDKLDRDTGKRADHISSPSDYLKQHIGNKDDLIHYMGKGTTQMIPTNGNVKKIRGNTASITKAKGEKSRTREGVLSITNKPTEAMTKPDIKAVELKPFAVSTHLILTIMPCPLWPQDKLRPQPTRMMTKESCSHHDGYVYLPDVKMCIRFIKKRSTWFEARKECWEDAADLVKSDTEKKQSSCHEFLEKQGKIPTISVPKRYWIGLQLQPCGSRWIDGSPLETNLLPKSSKRRACASARLDPFKAANKKSCKVRADAIMCEII